MSGDLLMDGLRDELDAAEDEIKRLNKLNSELLETLARLIEASAASARALARLAPGSANEFVLRGRLDEARALIAKARGE